ncbi:MAG: HAD family hydrolase [Thermomicrobiales bacterium]|nr:HAD family hydrolase [Thermomicrobiales bacterium]
MDAAAITFDFHNTLADCPEWFELEVRTLPSAYLRWHANQGAARYSDATLSTADDRYRTLRREIMDHGRELTAEQSLRAIFDDMAISADDAEIESGVAALMREAAGLARPIPGAVETVQAITQSGRRLGVVSSAVYHPFLEWTLEAFGIRNDFTTIVTSASAGFYKSRPEIYLHAADLLSARPNHMVHVGDSLRFDVGGAGRAGIGTVWLQHPGKPGDGSDYVPDLTLSSLEGSAPSILELLDARLQARTP